MTKTIGVIDDWSDTSLATNMVVLRPGGIVPSTSEKSIPYLGASSAQG